ncbi:MAG: purine nucleoside permease [Gammaproteobacteria bacterium]|nr:purine nucleoside permease [Gammaproteobacteria bacterium]
MFKRMLLILLIGLVTSSCSAETERILVKVVVVTMFESGEVTGDKPGEFQFWVERLDLKHVYPFEMGEYELRMNDDGVLGVCLGGGIPNATASIMALGLDTRFDLTKAYWLIAGIAGADPEDMSLGSAAWARWIIDGDLLYEIDAREIPDGWPYGMIPLGAQKPADGPQDIRTGWSLNTIAFELNQDLVNWAFKVSKDTFIPDGVDIKIFRRQFDGYPTAQKPPFVTIGETLSASTYWHGALMSKWANDWVKLYSNEQMNFMTANMEDSGTLTALHRLGRIKLIDTDRIMVLRTASNFTIPPPGKDAAWSSTAPYPDDGLPAKESAFRVGNSVVKEILKNWNLFEDRQWKDATYRTHIE